MTSIPSLSATRDDTFIPRIYAIEPLSDAPRTPLPKIHLTVTTREVMLLVECIEQQIFQLKKRYTELGHSRLPTPFESSSVFEEMKDIREKIAELCELCEKICQ
jgi:hypothetical protein